MKDATLKDITKNELAEQYTKLKARTSKAAVVAKREGESLVEDVIVIATAGGLSYMMGGYHQDAGEAAVKDGHAEGTEKWEDAVAEGGQIVGVIPGA